MRKGIAVLFIVIAASSASPLPVYAAPPETATPTAKTLFQQSARAYQEGRFQDAVDLLLRARKLTREPVLLYDLGRAHEALGNFAEAADAYSHFLEEDPNAPDRKSVEGRIDMLRREVAAKTPAPVPASAPMPPPAPAPTATGSSDSVPAVPWILGGVGLVALGTGAGFGLSARSRYDDANGDRGQASAQSKYDDAKRDALLSTITLATGAVLVVTAGVWLVLRARAPKTAQALAGGALTF